MWATIFGMYYFAGKLLQPYPLILLVMAVLLALAWRDRTRRGWLLGLGTLVFVMLVFLSLPVGSCLVLGTLERQYPQRLDLPDDAQAIVVLSGYVSRANAVRQESEAGPATALRCIAAADVYRRYGQPPVIITGDSWGDGPNQATVMGELMLDLGVARDDITLEKKARSTYENAVFSARILNERGINKIYLVTDASHMLRSELCFQKQGIVTIPVPCYHRAATLPDDLHQNLIPSAGPLHECDVGVHEWVGLLWYWLQGRIR